jgi:hypothetical protein
LVTVRFVPSGSRHCTWKEAVAGTGGTLLTALNKVPKSRSGRFASWYEAVPAPKSTWTALGSMAIVQNRPSGYGLMPGSNSWI